MWNMICLLLCSVAAICFNAIDLGITGLIVLIWMVGINLGCYVEDIKDQNKDLKNDLNAANKKLDQLEKLINLILEKE